ncbi:UPF0721 transmembrane protein [Clostridia bacterium]|nr:UPF0721 transmembrane protein [Clostridia bacterium]
MKKTAILGLIAGFLNGLFGAGGGTVIVPAMQKFLGIETKKSHATAIAVILPLSAVSMFVYLGKGDIEWNAVLLISAGGLAGGFVGAKLLSKTPKNIIHKVFGICMILAAWRMVSG